MGWKATSVEANTFYQDEHRLQDGRRSGATCDFVMANPPFNVDMVDAEKVKDDRRLPFGLPGVNKDKKVSNGNYLWISYFHSYLGRRPRRLRHVLAGHPAPGTAKRRCAASSSRPAMWT